MSPLPLPAPLLCRRHSNHVLIRMRIPTALHRGTMGPLRTLSSTVLATLAKPCNYGRDWPMPSRWLIMQRRISCAGATARSITASTLGTLPQARLSGITKRSSMGTRAMLCSAVTTRTATVTSLVCMPTISSAIPLTTIHMLKYHHRMGRALARRECYRRDGHLPPILRNPTATRTALRVGLHSSRERVQHLLRLRPSSSSLPHTCIRGKLRRAFCRRLCRSA